MTVNAMPRILVDADACPVKQEIIKVAERHQIPVIFVANSGLRPSRDPLISNVIVSGKFDAADDWIVNEATNKDIIVTNDILLAERCVHAGASVLGATGRAFTEQNIGMVVATRDLNQTLRESGAISGHNAAFSPRDRSNFLQQLHRLAVQAASTGSPA